MEEKMALYSSVVKSILDWKGEHPPLYIADHISMKFGGLIVFPTKRMATLLAGALLYVFLSSHIPAHAASVRGDTPGQNFIVCTGPNCPGGHSDAITAGAVNAGKDKKDKKGRSFKFCKS